MIVALNIAAMSEALTLATKAGVNPIWSIRRFAAVWLAARYWMRKRRWSWTETLSRFRIDLHIKDLANALDTSTALARSSR